MGLEIEKTREQRAADELMSTVQQKLDGKRAAEIAALAYTQAQLANAALQGLVELLSHKNVISAVDLAGALRHSYQRATDKLTSRQSSIILPDSVTTRPQ